MAFTTEKPCSRDNMGRCWIVALSVLISLAALTGLFNGCDREKDREGEIVGGTGTVIYLDFEGGFYGIEADNGESYDPINMDPEFERDGLRVQFSGRIRDDLLSTHQWGYSLELTCIQIIE